MKIELAGLDDAPEVASRWLLRAVEARAGPAVDASAWHASLEADRRAGRLVARLLRLDGRPVGLAAWSAATAMGTNLDLFYLNAGTASAEAYASALAAVIGEVGRLVFAPGPLAGVAPAEEERLMTGLGFAPYGRSEMQLPVARDLPRETSEGPGRVRGVVASDLASLAEVHRRAYHDRFDRYLFLQEADEASDALREVRDILDGRFGELDPDGSVVLEIEGKPVAQVLAVRRPDGVLLADVAVDPGHQGQGLGRRTLLESLRRLRAAPAAKRIYLNVTEGNQPAVALYQRLGFARSLGPSRDWYNTACIPFGPSRASRAPAR